MKYTALALLLLAFVGPPFAAVAAPAVAAQSTQDWAQRKGMQHLQRWLADRGMTQADVSILRVWHDSSGMGHLQVRQRHHGVRVFGGEIMVHMRSDGSLFGVTDSSVPGLDVDVQPGMSAQAAIETAKRATACSRCVSRSPRVDLWVMRRGEQDFLAYRVRLFREDASPATSMPVLLIDAHSGQVLMSYDNLQTASGTGVSQYSGPVGVTTSLFNGTYYLEDVTRKLGTVTYNNGTSAVARLLDPDNSWNAAHQRTAIDAHYGAARTYDYFLSVHGRNGIDGNGGPSSVLSADGTTGLLTSRIRYSSRYNNAFWNGQYMTYGDGDGVLFGPLVTLDITAHEMTHGITERTAGLIYSGESGALNESMSDVFGAMVERYAYGENADTFRIGEAAYTPNVVGDSLRYLDDPHAASNNGFTADDDPDHYSERYAGSSDNGGVHVNSGIANKAFYLLAKGGSHHLGGSMTGIGADDAARVWYSALTNFMTSSTNFAGARTATLNAATLLHGASSTQYTAVAQAWCLVGVGACAAAPSLFANGGFEGSLSPSIATGTGALYTSIGNFPRSGTGYAYLGAANSVTGQIYQQITIPAGVATATLVYGLNVSSAETTTTTQYDQLFVEVRNTAGALLTTLATHSNLNKRAAGSYGQFTRNLIAYRGQTVRIQFRTSTDSSAITTFRIDDVSAR